MSSDAPYRRFEDLHCYHNTKFDIKGNERVDNEFYKRLENPQSAKQVPTEHALASGYTLPICQYNFTECHPLHPCKIEYS